MICNNTVTVVGKDYSNGNYIVCFGDNMLYSLRKRELRKYKMTNIYVEKLDKRYIRSIFACSSITKSKIKKILQDSDEQIMVFRNMRKVGLL